MDIDNLKAFLAVVETGSFSLAADKLFLTQPAISKRIAILEERLNSALFDRIGRQVSLTTAGEALLPRANHILQELEDIQRSITNLSGQVHGTLSIATSHHIGLHRLPLFIREYSRQYPDVNLELQFVDSEVAHQMVAQGKVEIAIVTLALDPLPQLISKKLWNDPLIFIAAQGHPLTKQSSINLNDLSLYNAILPSSNTYTRQIVQQMFEANNIKLNVSMETNYLETIKMLVSVKLGWSVLPATMLDKKIKQLKLKQVTLARKLGYIVHQGRTLSNAAQAFIQQLNINN